MPKLVVFNSISLDGFFTDANGDMSWAHRNDPEFNAFAAENAKGGGRMLFGRKTSELRKSYWPTPAAMKNDPVIAEQMNNLPKVVFSRTLNEASWKNTKLVKGNIAAEVRKLKNEPGPDMVMMGSGTIISQLAPEGLIDEYQIVLNPLVLGKGRTMFEDVTNRLPLNLTKTRPFKSGVVVLYYATTA
jgi:dihydrofolate reductase